MPDFVSIGILNEYHLHASASSEHRQILYMYMHIELVAGKW
jgi:hypothetical protein